MTKQSPASTRFTTRFSVLLVAAAACLLLLAQAQPAASAEAVTLAWDANIEDEVAGYNLYYTTDSTDLPFQGTGLAQGDSPVAIQAASFADPATPTMSLSGLEAGQTYHFAVTAFNAEGLESDYSAIVSYKVPMPVTYTVTASATGSGTISPDGTVTVLEGDSRTINFAPDEGFLISEVIVDGISAGTPESYTFDNVSASHSIEVVYAEAPPEFLIIYEQLSNDVLTIASVDSEEMAGEDGSADNVVDGDPSTIWHTEWYFQTPTHPHEITIDTDDLHQIAGIRYLPRQDGSQNGTVLKYAIFISQDGLDWQAPVTEGIFDRNTELKDIRFSATAGRYVRFQALSEINGRAWTSAAEIEIIVARFGDSDGDSIPDNEEYEIYGTDPNNADSDGDGISDGDELAYWGNGWAEDADGDGIINLLDDDADNDGITDGDELDAGTDPSEKPVVIEEITEKPHQILSSAQLSIHSADSEELNGEDGAAENAIDGNTKTFWHTEWYHSAPAAPHEIVIDLGDTCEVSGLQYLPRQDGSVNGTVKEYEVYVSADGAQWGMPVAVGSFARDTNLKSVSFDEAVGRFIRFRALSEINGKPWTSAAEINVIGIVLAEPEILPRSQLLIHYADSEEWTGEDGAADNAIDGDTNTFWHTEWYYGSPTAPHEIIIDLGRNFHISAMHYLPRQDGSVNGTIRDYEIYVSLDGSTWGTPVAKDSFARDTSLKRVNFIETKARFIRFRALSEINGKPWTSAAEINIIAR